MKKLVLVDGHAILHRAYHAFPKTLNTRQGELVNAVYGFTRMLLKVIEDLQPAYLAVAFDLPKPTFRHREFIGYQVQRPKMDAELGGQIERVFQMVRTLNIPIFTAEGFEADDVIASLVEQAKHKFESPTKKAGRRNSKFEIIVVTGDKDIMQLVNKRVKVYAPVRGFAEAKLFGPKEVEEYLGVEPSQIIDYKALVGDSSDNYPGVAGIGPKTAVNLLREYGTLERIYGEIDPSSFMQGRTSEGPGSPKGEIGKLIPERVRDKLSAGRESAKLSQKLATIVTDAPVKLNLKACLVHEYDQEKARRLFEELEFKSLIDKLPGKNQESRMMNLESSKKDNQLKLL